MSKFRIEERKVKDGKPFAVVKIYAESNREETQGRFKTRWQAEENLESLKSTRSSRRISTRRPEDM